MFMGAVTLSTTLNLTQKINMNTNTIIKLIVVIIFFVIGWNLENGFLTWLCFSLGSIVIIYPFFMGKRKD